MKDKYIIRHLPEGMGAFRLRGIFDPKALPEIWAKTDEARIDSYPWGGEYRPECAARVGWNASGLHVLMYAREAVIRAKETRIGGDICHDSCLEFFVGFDEASLTYVNCECNPKSVMHIGLGQSRYDRTICAEIPAGFEPSHSEHNGAWWAVGYTIPADFIREHFGVTLSAGMVLRGNFYKCGDMTEHPHYGMFKPYDLPKPDFHRPELFADLVADI